MTKLKLKPWLCALTLACLTQAIHAQTPRKDRTVVVISLDGFPAYALDDPRLPIPTLRKLASEGVIAKSMQPVNPTVTWPNHTAIATGVEPAEHKVLYNGLLIHHEGARPTVEMWVDKEKLVHARTIYDAAYEAGLTTAQVDWVAIYNPKTITWQFPEIPDPNGKIEQELIAAGKVTADQLKTFENSSQSWQDQIWTDAAKHILEKYKPNLLLFHLLTGDDINHKYAPMSEASFTAFAFLDGKVKEVMDVLEQTGQASNTTVIIVSDHGFRTYTHKISPNVLLREKGLIMSGGGQPKGEAWVMPEGGTATVYVTDPAKRGELVPKLRTILANAEGIEAIYGAEDFSKLGLPAPSTSDQAPDLFLTAKPDYMFSNDFEGDYASPVAPAAGTHGYINTDPKMQAIFIAWGAGVPKGVKIDSITNRDVAPTIAALLGVQLKEAQGHAIPEIVKP